MLTKFYFLALDGNGDISKWGLCLPECPMEEVEPVCLDDPQPPKFGDNSTSYNFTSDFVFGLGIPTAEVSPCWKISRVGGRSRF